MANIKISDLPVLATPPAMDDVIIINDTSANTTCKTTVAGLFSDGNLNTYTPSLYTGLTSNQTLEMNANRITPYFGRILIRTNATTTITNTTANYVPLRITIPNYFSSLLDVPFNGNITDISGMTVGDGSTTVTGDIIGLHWRPVALSGSFEYRLVFLVKSQNSVYTQPLSIAPNSQITMSGIFINTFAWGYNPGFTQ